MFLRWSSLNNTGPHISLVTSWNNRSMRILDARARAEELKDLNLFIAMTAEDGDGEVVAVKDLVDVRGTPTTGGGRLLPSEPKSEDAPLIRNLRSHGCVMIGKTNHHEWAFGSTNMNRHYGTVHNPRDRSRVAGGSSGSSRPSGPSTRRASYRSASRSTRSDRSRSTSRPQRAPSR